MSGFRPVRASSPPKRSSHHLLPPNPSDTSASSNSSLVLASLTPKDIKVIDSIIQKASPTATTFLAIFKAYNDALKEFGLDANDDVVYYRFLLKLGVVRGNNWGDRWKTVKNQLARGLPPGGPSIGDSEDEGSEHHHHSQTETETESATEYDSQPPPFFTSTPQPRRVLPKAPAVVNQVKPSVPANLRIPHHLPPIKVHVPPPQPQTVTRPRSKTDVKTSRPPPLKALDSPRIRPQAITDISQDSTPATSTPPSYRTFAPEKTPVARTPGERIRVTRPPAEQTPIVRPSVHPRTLAEFAEAAAKTGKVRLNVGDKAAVSAINADETWKVLRMEREADDFRRFMLIRRCWDVWEQGVQWLKNTNTQLDTARKDILLRECMDIWKTKSTKRLDIEKRAANVSAVLTCRKAFKIWQVQFHDKRRRAWQAEMRTKLNHVRGLVVQRILRDAFQSWKQSHQNVKATQVYAVRVLRNTVERWQTRLARVRRLSKRAETICDRRDQTRIVDAFTAWKRRTSLNGLERIIAHMRSVNMASAALRVWKKASELRQITREQRQAHILKAGFAKWRKAFNRIQLMERRATKYVGRQELILQKSVLRIWVAKERGQRLDRTKRLLLSRDALAVWKEKLHAVRSLNKRADMCVRREQRSLAFGAFAVWKSKLRRQRDALVTADQHRSRQLASSSLLSWRVQLAVILRMTRSSRIARRFFVMNDAFRAWKLALAERRRERKLKLLETGVQRKVFVAWRFAAQRQRQHRFLCMAFEEKVQQRVKSEYLADWIQRVVERKVVELQVYDGYNRKIVRSAFGIWKAVRERHKEEMSLMQSYHDIKREDLVRRVFIRWLSAARRSIHNQQRLEKREEERRARMVMHAWEQWRERYKERELAGLEKILSASTKMNVVFRAFRIWESKTMTVPAVRFASLQLKARTLRRWTEALPRARREREAREIYRQKVLAAALATWKTKYRSKIAFVSAVRARHIRLPAAAPGRSAFRTTPPSASLLGPSSRPAFAFSSGASPSVRLPSPDRRRLASPERPRGQAETPRSEHRPRAGPASRASVSPVREPAVAAAVARTSLLSRTYVRNALVPKPSSTASVPDLTSLSNTGKIVHRRKPASTIGGGARDDEKGLDGDDDNRSVAGSARGSARKAASERGAATTPRTVGMAAGSPLHAALDRGRLRLELRGRAKLNVDDDD